MGAGADCYSKGRNAWFAEAKQEDFDANNNRNGIRRQK
jgi:hypothetical protein